MKNPAARQKVMDGLLAQVAATMAQPTFQKTDWQLLEVKQMAEIAHRYRVKACHMLQELRAIEVRRAEQTDEVEKIYANYEAMFARDNLRASLRLYKIANHDFHHAYADYMSKIEQNAFSWIPGLGAVNNNTNVAGSRAA